MVDIPPYKIIQHAAEMLRKWKHNIRPALCPAPASPGYIREGEGPGSPRRTATPGPGWTQRPRGRAPAPSALPPLCALRARPPLLPQRTATPARGSALAGGIPGSSPGRSAPSRPRTRAPSRDTAPGGRRLLTHEGRRSQRRAPPGFLLLLPRRGERPRPRAAAANGHAERCWWTAARTNKRRDALPPALPRSGAARHLRGGEPARKAATNWRARPPWQTGVSTSKSGAPAPQGPPPACSPWPRAHGEIPRWWQCRGSAASGPGRGRSPFIRAWAAPLLPGVWCIPSSSAPAPLGARASAPAAARRPHPGGAGWEL